MVQSQSMTNFLTHHQIPPGSIVVSCGVEISIIYFGHSLHNMQVAINPDLGETQPAVIPILGVADFHPTRGSSAITGFGTTRHNSCIKDSRFTPISGSGAKNWIPNR